MKFVLILAVAVLAVSTITPSSSTSLNFSKVHLAKNSEERNGLIDGLTKIIKDIIEKTQQALDDILEQIEEILQNVTDTIQKVIDEAKDIIDEIAYKSLKILDKIARQDEISRECVEQSRPDLDVAISEHSLEIQVCQAKAIDDTQNIKNDIEPHIEAIQDNIKVLENIVTECLKSNENLLGAVSCIIKKTDEIKTELVKLIYNAKDALLTVPIRANEIIHDVRVCIENSNNKFEQRIAEIIKNVNQCIEDNQGTTVVN